MRESLPSRHAAVLTTSWPRHPEDGAGHFVAAEVEELLRDRWEVTVLAPGQSVHGPPGCRVIPLGGDELFTWPGALPRLREDPRRALEAVRVVHRARRQLQKLAPFDRVVAHWLLPSAWPLLVGIFPGKHPSPLRPGGYAEMVAHGSDVRLLLKFPSFVRNHILRQLCAPHLHLRFVSRALRDELLDAPLLPPDLRNALRARSSVRPAAIQLPALPSRLHARGQFGVRAEEWLIVVASRLISEKRVAVALEGAHLVPHSRVVVLGSGPELEPLRVRFPNVHFVGHVPRPEALAWMRACDVVLSASRLEGAPTVIREARALGVPVVACAAGDLTEWARLDPDLWLLDA